MSMNRSWTFESAGSDNPFEFNPINGSMSETSEANVSTQLHFEGSMSKALEAYVSTQLHFDGSMSKASEANVSTQLHFDGSMSEASEANVSTQLQFNGSTFSMFNEYEFSPGQKFVAIVNYLMLQLIGQVKIPSVRVIFGSGVNIFTYFYLFPPYCYLGARAFIYVTKG